MWWWVALRLPILRWGLPDEAYQAYPTRFKLLSGHAHGEWCPDEHFEHGGEHGA